MTVVRLLTVLDAERGGERRWCEGGVSKIVSVVVILHSLGSSAMEGDFYTPLFLLSL